MARYRVLQVLVVCGLCALLLAAPGMANAQAKAALIQQAGLMGVQQWQPTDARGLVGLGDINGDSFPDVVTASTRQPFWMNDGTGHFSPSTFAFPENVIPDGLLLDVDGDADLDLVVGVSAWKNDGKGNFTAPATSQTSSFAILDAGDLNGDQRPDLVYYSIDPRALNSTMGFLFNDGSGNFANKTEIFHGFFERSYAAAVGDINGDGRNDLLFGESHFNSATQRYEASIKLWTNGGSGTFSEKPSLALGHTCNAFTEGRYIDDVLLADIDGDSDLDLSMAHQCGTGHFWLNDGTGNFSDSKQQVCFKPVLMALGDFNNDGSLDGICKPWSDTRATTPSQLWLNDGSGHFSFFQYLGSGINEVVSGDVNLDGRDDAVTSFGTYPNIGMQVWMWFENLQAVFFPLIGG